CHCWTAGAVMRAPSGGAADTGASVIVKANVAADSNASVVLMHLMVPPGVLGILALVLLEWGTGGWGTVVWRMAPAIFRLRASCPRPAGGRGTHTAGSSGSRR